MEDDFNGLSFEDEAAPAAAEESAPAPVDDFEGLSLGDEAPDASDAPEEEAGLEDPKSDEIPEKYKFEDQDADFNETVGAVAKECGLSQAKAQKFASAVDSANMEFCAKQAQKWVKDLKADKDIGGDKFNASCALARRVFDKYGVNPELRELLSYSGLTNHPEFVRMFVRIGEDLKMTGAARRPAFPHSNMGA